MGPITYRSPGAALRAMGRTGSTRWVLGDIEPLIDAGVLAWVTHDPRDFWVKLLVSFDHARRIAKLLGLLDR